MTTEQLGHVSLGPLTSSTHDWYIHRRGISLRYHSAQCMGQQRVAGAAQPEGPFSVQDVLRRGLDPNLDSAWAPHMPSWLLIREIPDLTRRCVKVGVVKVGVTASVSHARTYSYLVWDDLRTLFYLLCSECLAPLRVSQLQQSVSRARASVDWCGR